MSDNEIILLKKAIDGDIESFEKLINKYQKYAYNIALKYMKDPNDAEDITQDALIKVFNNLSKFNMDSKFSTWLYRIVANTCKDELRKNQKKNNVTSLDDKDSYKNEIEDITYEPLKILEKKQLKGYIGEAIDTLKVNYREVIVLCDINDLSYIEISEILDIPVGTVRSRINRGRKKLREIINKMELLDVNPV